MTDQLDPEAVAKRLEELRALYVPDDAEAARAKMNAGAHAEPLSFDEQVAKRLEELRALMELTDYLHRGVVTPGSGS